MALFKYFTRQEKPTNSGSLLTKTEVEEADKAVAKILEPTLKTGASRRGKYNSYTSVQRGEIGREYYHVLFSNLRVMIEEGSIFDEYYGPNGFKWLSVIIYTVFLFLVITMLLNLLIAQMSDTYANVQSDAQRSLFIDRAWIVAKVEHSSLFASALIDYRKKNYRNCEVVDNLHNLLDKWEAPPISQVSKEIKQLHDSLKQQQTITEQHISEVTNELKQLKDQFNEVRNEFNKMHRLIREKETADTNYRVAMMEALNHQKQLIQELISSQETKAEI